MPKHLITPRKTQALTTLNPTTPSCPNHLPNEPENRQRHSHIEGAPRNQAPELEQDLGTTGTPIKKEKPDPSPTLQGRRRMNDGIFPSSCVDHTAFFNVDAGRIRIRVFSLSRIERWTRVNTPPALTSTSTYINTSLFLVTDRKKDKSVRHGRFNDSVKNRGVIVLKFIVLAMQRMR
ncbi:hypothetical protein K435DRAFT_89876 [Dendrothele bispora CBS 962.96]|uniref:Uncharacterized protein n=1 Tax=Dendrothele bispora (strain CBS 962.96) TaxID=1314807 RepID=A0A4S8M3C3_DENBC|nr:hypothetical protein K435DRAFT_89876 [Dendrothele bispora CBS 962.96]